MPIYAYKCEECNNDFKANKRAKERDNAECPLCQSKMVKRALSFAMHVKKAEGPRPLSQVKSELLEDKKKMIKEARREMEGDIEW